ncbi:hypothetical protein [Circo-like virus Croatia 17_S17]|nr:hypothetical protein [Circo-like virus Croatia 17_S17]
MKRNYHMRKYQRVKYQIPNVLNPDELVMTIKKNNVSVFDLSSVDRKTYPLLGIDDAEKGFYLNLEANIAKFKSMEILSGKLKLYIMPIEVIPRTTEGTQPSYQKNGGIMGYQTQKTWVDAEGGEQTETQVAKPSGYASMWNVSAETPGYGTRFITNKGSKVQKFTFKGSKKEWNVLKADPTGFTQSLPLPVGISPLNNKTVTIDITEITGPDWKDGTKFYVFDSHTLLVKFKGRKV